MHARAALWGDALAAARAGRGRARLAERQRRGQRARHAARAALPHGDLERQPGGAVGRRLPAGAGARGRRAVGRAVPRGRRRPAAVRRARGVRRGRRPRRRAEGRQLARRRARGGGAQRRARRRPARVPGAARGGRRGVGRGSARAARAGEGARRCRAAARPASAAGPAGSAILTCSGGDSAQGADEAARLGLDAAGVRAGDVRAPARAAAAGGDGRQPARLHRDDLGRRERSASSSATVAEDPAIDQVLVFYDQSRASTAPSKSPGARSATGSSPARRWPGVDDRLPRRCPSCSTTRPRGGSPRRDRAVAGLRTGLLVRRRAAAAARRSGAAAGDRAAARAAAGADAGGAACGWPSTRPRSCCAAPASRSTAASCRRGRCRRRARRARRAPRAEAQRGRGPAQDRARRARARAALRGRGAARFARLPRSPADRRRVLPSGWPPPGSS